MSSWKGQGILKKSMNYHPVCFVEIFNLYEMRVLMMDRNRHQCYALTSRHNMGQSMGFQKGI